ncbi:unnamed protein product, partial [Menidia menidia]
EKAKCPDQKTSHFGKKRPTDSFIGQGVYQCHIAIYANQNQEIYAAENIHAEACFAKNPVELIDYVDSPERQTGYQQKVRSSQVAQVDLSHCAGLLMEAENHQHKYIQDDSHNSDDHNIHRNSNSSDNIPAAENNDQKRSHKAQDVHCNLIGHLPRAVMGIIKNTGRNVILFKELHLSVNNGRERQQDSQHPQNQADYLGVKCPSEPPSPHGLHERQIAVNANHDQRVDAGVEVDDNGGADQFA